VPRVEHHVFLVRFFFVLVFFYFIPVSATVFFWGVRNVFVNCADRAHGSNAAKKKRPEYFVRGLCLPVVTRQEEGERKIITFIF